MYVTCFDSNYQTSKYVYDDTVLPQIRAGSKRSRLLSFSRQNPVLFHHFRTIRNSQLFLTAYLTEKGSRRYSLREPFSLFPAYQFLSLTFYSSLKNITFCVIIWLYNFLSHIWRVIAGGISSRNGVLARFSLGHTVLQKFKCSVRRLYKEELWEKDYPNWNRSIGDYGFPFALLL